MFFDRIYRMKKIDSHPANPVYPVKKLSEFYSAFEKLTA